MVFNVDYLLRGTTAYVSAGAHGIGEAIADLLVQDGAAVVVSDLDGDACFSPRRSPDSSPVPRSTSAGRFAA